MKTLISIFICGLILFSCGGSNEGISTNNDFSNSPNGEWLVPVSEIKDGGPGKDGIPSLDYPDFIDLDLVNFLTEDELVIGIIKDGQAYAYPHMILDWHEIVNDGLNSNPITISYCPLTGTAFGWKSFTNGSRTTFGVSGLLYNANLILYDRNTNSNWSQLRLECINGDLITETPSLVNIVETNWSTWQLLYPDSKVLSLATGLFRDYGTYPYGDYKTDHSYFIFPVSPLNNALPSKKRVFAIINDGQAKVYQFEDFKNGKALVDTFNGKQFLIVGNENIINAFELPPNQQQRSYHYDFRGSEAFFNDNDGNVYSVFGATIQGSTNNDLTPAVSVNSYWFAIAVFYPDPIIFE